MLIHLPVWTYLQTSKLDSNSLNINPDTHSRQTKEISKPQACKYIPTLLLYEHSTLIDTHTNTCILPEKKGMQSGCLHILPKSSIHNVHGSMQQIIYTPAHQKSSQGNKFLLTRHTNCAAMVMTSPNNIYITESMLFRLKKCTKIDQNRTPTQPNSLMMTLYFKPT